MTLPVLEFNYDISCPFAYIASTRVETLAQRTSATLIWKPVLLGAIYRATSAPQGASGSASDVFNAAKKSVTARSMQRTLRRYNISYNPPVQHPRKSVNALRLIYHVPADHRPALSKALFMAYWVENRDVTDTAELLKVARECGIPNADQLTEGAFKDPAARTALENETAEAISRGAFGVPGFWIPDANWTDFTGEQRQGRFYWGQDRMHFVEAELLALRNKCSFSFVPGLRSLMPRCIASIPPSGKVRLEFWYDFSSPWAFLAWTQLPRLQRTFGENLEIVMKPFLLGILFREIGAPNEPGLAISQAKAVWSRQDHADWAQFWNAVNKQNESPEKPVQFYWADVFPIRTPTVLRCAIIEPNCVPVLYRACWEQNVNVSDEAILADILTTAGYDGVDSVKRASAPAIKARLRENTAEAKAVGLCGVPSYRVFKETCDGRWTNVGGIIWGQDETNVVEDLIAGWDDENSQSLAEPYRTILEPAKARPHL